MEFLHRFRSRVKEVGAFVFDSVDERRGGGDLKQIVRRCDKQALERKRLSFIRTHPVVGVAKIDEVYGRWLRTPSAETLDPEKLFESIAKLPPYARNVWPIQPRSSPDGHGENREIKKIA